jgi:hypothetical protein
MSARDPRRNRLLAGGVFVAATALLGVQLVSPPLVVVTVGETSSVVGELGGGSRRLALVAGAAALVGASGAYLLFGPSTGQTADTADSASGKTMSGDADDTAPSDELLAARREEWADTAERLGDTERVVYETVLDADGVLPQRDIVERTDLSKATVSRTLDSLEARDTVERRRRGVGNVVFLK